MTTAAFTIDRVILIFTPLKTHVHKEKRLIRVITILSIVLVSVSVYLPMTLFESSMIFNNDTNIIEYSCSDLWSGASEWYCIVAGWSIQLLVIVSIAIMIPLNAALAIKLHLEYKRKR